MEVKVQYMAPPCIPCIGFCSYKQNTSIVLFVTLRDHKEENLKVTLRAGSDFIRKEESLQ